MPARADHRAQTQSSHATNDCSLRSLDVSYAELTASFAALRTRGRTTLRRGAFVRQQLAVPPTPGRAGGHRPASVGAVVRRGHAYATTKRGGEVCCVTVTTLERDGDDACV